MRKKKETIVSEYIQFNSARQLLRRGSRERAQEIRRINEEKWTREWRVEGGKNNGKTWPREHTICDYEVGLLFIRDTREMDCRRKQFSSAAGRGSEARERQKKNPGTTEEEEEKPVGSKK